MPSRALSGVRDISRIAIFVLSSLVLVDGAGAAVNIVFNGGTPGTERYRSDGMTELPTDGSFFFELGTFVDGFAPTADNTDDWLSNWVMMTDSEGAPHPGARAEYTMRSQLFQDFDGFSSEVELDHNLDPFTPGAQGFLWGYNERETPGTAEWILVTNSTEWLFPSGLVPGSALTWSLGTADSSEALVGTQDGNSLVMGEVIISAPQAVPEPAGATLIIIGAAALSARRRR